MSESGPIYKLALLGPTRSGKTSLVSSILAGAQDYLRGQAVDFVAEGPTLKRIRANRNDLDAALQAGVFNPGALAGGIATSRYHLALSVGKSRLRMEILDYPGGWLDMDKPPPEFEEVGAWFGDASILLVPVDAVVAMECATNGQVRAAWNRLNVAAITDWAQSWARQRVARLEKGVLIIAPVKCETYFADNGGTRDRSSDLKKRILCETYKQVVDVVRRESDDKRLVDGYYMPIDTMGCVHLVEADWATAPDGDLECRAQYRVRAPGERRVFGAGDVLVAIAGHLATAEKCRDKGFLLEFWQFLTGEGAALAAVIKSLSDRQYGNRVEKFL